MNRRRLILLAATALGVALAWPASSQAFIACSYSAGELRVDMTADGDSATFQRFGDQIAVLTGSSIDSYDDYYGGETQILIPCSGGTPTVQNTDHVSVIQNPSDEHGDVTIDESAGPFAPGATAESDGSSEIEFGLNLPGRRSAVAVKGSDSPDLVRVGTLSSGASGINLNGPADGSSPDVDVEAAGPRDFEVDTEGGDDSVTGLGGPEFAGPLRNAFIFTDGGPGNDFLQSGPVGAALFGDEGKDTLIGSPRRDLLVGGIGRDKMFAGHGSDRVFSADRKKDLVVCGAGKRDFVIADFIDRATHCEHGRRVRLRKHHPGPVVFPDAVSARRAFP